MEYFLVKIMCFGDSLTVGYQSPTPEHPYYRETPYAHLLQQWFGEKATIMVRGLNGEFASEMVHRFMREVIPYSPDYAVILGGTNDLGAHEEVPAIFDSLTQLLEAAKNASVQPIAITIPSLRNCGGDEYTAFLDVQISRRIELNHLLMEYCHDSGIVCVDLFSETLEKTSSQLAEEYSNDGIHLSSAGYEVLANLLWDEVWGAEHTKRV